METENMIDIATNAILDMTCAYRFYMGIDYSKAADRASRLSGMYTMFALLQPDVKIDISEEQISERFPAVSAQIAASEFAANQRYIKAKRGY